MTYTKGQAIHLAVTIGLTLLGTAVTVVGGDDTWGYLVQLATGEVIYATLGQLTL